VSADAGSVSLELRHESGLRATVVDALLLAQRSLRHTTRVPPLIVFATIQPIMFVLLFRYVFGGAIAVPTGTYVNFLMPGIFVQTVAFGAMTTGIGLSFDMQAGLIDRFRSLPMSRSAVMLGRTLSDLVRNAFIVALMLAVGLLVGFRPDGSALGFLAGIGLLLLFTFSFSWIGATIGLLVTDVEAVQSAGFIWLFPLTFASSAFVPPASMPAWLRAFADNQPISKIVNAVRGLMLGTDTGSNAWIALTWCVGILVAFVPLSTWAYRHATGTVRH
jgi:ABC transporter DrrB family efflux protein